MATVANILVGLVALLHVYFMILEMFFWDKPLGLRVFGQTQADATASKVLAANQGLYNGFLAAGLVWGLLNGAGGYAIKLFFLACVAIAGVFGVVTTKNQRILLVQTLPAVVAAALLILSR